MKPAQLRTALVVFVTVALGTHELPADRIRRGPFEDAEPISGAARPIDARSQPTASAANYTFTTSTTGSLTDMSGGTVLLIRPAQPNSSSLACPIGFNFYFQGARHDSFSVNTNGTFLFGNFVVSHAISEPLGQGSHSYLAPCASAQMVHPVDGRVHSKVLGTAPHRTLVVEWCNMQSDHREGGTADLTYQLRLSETSGEIEFIYGAMSMSVHGARASSSQSLQIGFSNGTASGSIGTVSAPQSGSPAPTYDGLATAPVKNACTAGPIPALGSAADGARRTFKFTPTPVAAPTGLNFTSVALTAMSVNWTDTPGARSYAIYRSTDGVNFTYAGKADPGTGTFAATDLSANTTYHWRVCAVSEGAVNFVSGSQTTAAPTPVSSVGTGGGWSSPGTRSGSAVPDFS